jgi:Cu-Zn family superoxide dismutase
MSFYDKRFSLQDILGRSVIIHNQPDDFTTQPSGNSGAMIGCGVIMKN